MLAMVALCRYSGLMLLACAGLGCRPRAADMLASSEIREHLAFTTLLGREIHRRDKLTWWAGQVVHSTLSPEQSEAVVGWVVDIDHPETDVLFFDGEGNVGLIVRCVTDGPEGCRVEAPSSPMVLSERNQAQYRAVMTAWEHPAFEQTSEVYNPVVIPAGAGPDVDWWVYLIAWNRNPNLIVLGQHYRFIVDATGQKVESFRPFADGDIAIDVKADGTPEGAQPLAISVSHPLDDVPTEMHVWAAVTWGIDLLIATEPKSKRRDPPPTMWRVDFNGNVAPFE